MPMGRGNAWRAALLALIVAGVAAALWLLPVNRWLGSLLEWVQRIGPWGPAVVAAFYVAACVFFLPGSVLTLAAGFLFGIWLGTLVTWVGATAGAAAAFGVGRTIARDWIARRLANNRRFAAIDRAVGREGFKIVLLTRLSPVFPFNLLNYAFGLTSVSFGRYLLASAIGMLPGTVMYVYLGSTLRSLADVLAGRYHGGTPQTVFFIAGLIVTAGVTLWITRVARRALREVVDDDESNA